MQMAHLQYRFDKKILLEGKTQIKTQDQLAKKYRALIEQEVDKYEV